MEELFRWKVIELLENMGYQVEDDQIVRKPNNPLIVNLGEYFHNDHKAAIRIEMDLDEKIVAKCKFICLNETILFHDIESPQDLANNIDKEFTKQSRLFTQDREQIYAYFNDDIRNYPDETNNAIEEIEVTQGNNNQRYLLTFTVNGMGRNGNIEIRGLYNIPSKQLYYTGRVITADTEDILDQYSLTHFIQPENNNLGEAISEHFKQMASELYEASLSNEDDNYWRGERDERDEQDYWRGDRNV